MMEKENKKQKQKLQPVIKSSLIAVMEDFTEPYINVVAVGLLLFFS